MATNPMIMLRQSFALLNLHTISRTIFLRSVSNKSIIAEKLGLPEKPKRPNPPFTYFFNTIKAELTEKHPNDNFSDLLKKAAKVWEQASPEKKQEIRLICKAEMDKYKKKLEKYKKSLTDEQKAEIREAETEIKSMRDKKLANFIRGKRLKILERPKKPQNPYIKYCVSMKHKKGNESQREFYRKIAEEWKSVPEETKKEMKLEFHKEYEEYKKDLSMWEDKMIKEGNLDVVRIKTLKNKFQISS